MNLLTLSTHCDCVSEDGAMFIIGSRLHQGMYNLLIISASARYNRIDYTTSTGSRFQSFVRDYSNNFGGVVKGYFKAPITGSYRFYLRSDDSSILEVRRLLVCHNTIAARAATASPQPHFNLFHDSLTLCPMSTHPLPRFLDPHRSVRQPGLTTR